MKTQYKVRFLYPVLCTVVCASAQTTAPTSLPAGIPPPYTVLRYDEDYSYLRDPALRSDPLDVVKYVPLNEQGDWYASFGGQVRDRHEFFNHNTFGAGPQDRDGYNLLRVMANADFHFGPYVRAFVQGIDATEQGREGGPRPIDVDQADLHQGFVDVTVPLADRAQFMVRGGRQNLLFGAQRLIGPLDWANVRRTFDGFRGTLSSPGNDLDLFYVRPVLADKYRWDNDLPRTDFAGVYDTWRIPALSRGVRARLEVYGLYLRRQNVTYPTDGTGREDRYTLGTRLSGNAGPFDFDVEPDFQFGQFHGEDIHAYSLAAVGGYTLRDVLFAPHPFLGFDIASGDHTPHGGGLGTFNQLFPTGHVYFGYIDAIGRQNIIDLHPGLGLMLLKNKPMARKLALTTEYHLFWRASDRDAVYNAAGGVLRAGASGATNVGSELDLLLDWQIDRHTSFYAGYSHFFAGTFLRQTGAHQDIDFLYAALTYTL